MPFLAELVVHRACREVRERDGYFVVSDEDNERFYWGNYVHLKDAPRDANVGDLERLHQEELPHVRDRFVFTYNDDLDLNLTSDGRRRLLAGEGYGFEVSVCLVGSPASIEADLPRVCEVRGIETDEDWRRAVENQLLCRDPEGGEEHVLRRMRSARGAVERGHGRWMGAFGGERLVGDLGIFWSGKLCGFQAIGTHPDRRRRGIARRMVVDTVKLVSREIPTPSFVILTGMDDAPRKLYERWGFVPISTHVGAVKRTTR